MSEVKLPQTAAVMALERNDLDMDKAVRDVYRQKMNSNALYGYIWGELEGGGIRKTQNDRVKQMIKAENYQKNVSGIFLPYIYLSRVQHDSLIY